MSETRAYLASYLPYARALHKLIGNTGQTVRFSVQGLPAGCIGVPGFTVNLSS